MEEQILDFIKRKFSNENNWMNGNCFFFAQILRVRFHGDVVYDPIEGHFLLWAPDGNFYDWTGKREYNEDYSRKFFIWSDYAVKDPLHYSRIYRDCIQ